MRWIGNPESVGLRFVGLAHDVAPANYSYLRNAVQHAGWYLSDDNWTGETVSGVVYQLSGKAGRARYVVGYADPYNCDKDGHGPACLDLSRVYDGDRKDSDWEYDHALRDVARHADGHAESMAEIEREYQAAFVAGRDAREKAELMREAGALWVDSIRALRATFAIRHMSPMFNVTRMLIKNTRKLCEEFNNARDEFHKSLDHGYHNIDQFREGYDA